MGDRVRVMSHTGSAQRFAVSKLESRVLDAKRRGSTFGARRREVNLCPMGGGARVGGQMNKTA